MSSEDRRVLAVAGFAALCCLPLRAVGPSAPPLGNAASFAVLGGSAVTNSGDTIVTGNLGVSPGNTITGFPPGKVKLGDTFKNDALAKAAHGDAGIVYNDLANRLSSPCPALKGTLKHGTFHCGPVLLTEPLILDAEGDPTAVWIFQIAGSLTTDPDSSILAINSAQPGNVFWQVSGSAILGADSTFVGNLIAHDNITLNSNASAFGRLLALTGTVTLNSNNATLCSTCNEITLNPSELPGGTVGTPYPTTTIKASGGADPYTYKVISGSLPKGLGPLTTKGVLSGTPTEFGSFLITVAATDSQGCSGEQKYTIAIACQGLTLSPATLLDATACVPFEQLITASGGSGSYKYTSTTLPVDLMLNPEIGVPSTTLSESVLAPGVYPLTITAEDTVTHCTVSQTYTLKVNCNLIISPATLPTATACASYCTTLNASCPDSSFSAAPGTLPAGFTLSTDGILCVAPTTPGRYTFTVTATDKLGCIGTRTYTVPVGPGPIAISPSALPDGIVGTIYPEQTITANCGTPGYTCRVTAGMLPPGLSLTNCKISGTPATAGCFTFSVTVTDANGASNSIRYRICVTCPITIMPAKLPDGSVCVFYKQALTANCATAPYTCNLSGGLLPPGLTLSNCSISGIPETAGLSAFTITLTDAISNTVNRTYTLLVTGGVAISPPTLPAAELGSPYNAIIIASGGTPPYTFSLSGSLPPGLSLNTATGEISGTPTALGTFIFCITFSDANMIPQCTATRCYIVDVIPPLVGGPTLSGWGMLLLSILLAGAGLVIIRRDN
jgi:hypothetical protein